MSDIPLSSDNSFLMLMDRKAPGVDSYTGLPSTKKKACVTATFGLVLLDEKNRANLTVKQ